MNSSHFLYNKLVVILYIVYYISNFLYSILVHSRFLHSVLIITLGTITFFLFVKDTDLVFVNLFILCMDHVYEGQKGKVV